MRKFLLTALLMTSLAGAVGAPANSTIANTASMDLEDGMSTTTLNSNTVNITVQQVYGVDIAPNGTNAAPGQTVTVFPGQTGTLKYTVTNTGNGADTINLNVLTANTTAAGANIVGIYVDSNNNGTFEAGTDTAVTSLSALAADATKTVFVRYTVPTGTTGGSAAGSAHLLNLTGSSDGDGTKTDTNNVGRITVDSVFDLSLTGTPTSTTVGVNSTATFTDTLTNTGNAPLSATDITATVGVTTTDKTGTAITNPFTVTYTVSYNSTSVTNADLETAINSVLGAGTLPAGGVITITPNVTPTAAYKDGDKIVLALETYSPTAASGTLINNAQQGDAQGKLTNTVTAQRGVGSTTKSVAVCPTETTCPTYATATAQGAPTTISAKPGDYVVYYLTAKNTGTGNLFNVRLKDALPADFVPTSVGAAATGVTGTLKYSTNGTTWYDTVPALGTLTGGTSTLYVAIDNGGPNTTITTVDVFTAGGELRVKIVGYIRKDNTTYGGTVTLDANGL